MGAGRQGLALARYLLSQEAAVTLNDSRSAHALTGPMSELAGHSRLTWVTGGHPIELAEQADLVCPSGGVPLELPLLQRARERGLPFSNDSQVFLEVCPCRVIGITGSAGKTTTTTLVGRMTAAAVELGELAHHFVGGNIGNPLIADVEQMQAGDIAVMELSSFQLDIMTRSPQIAAILNLTPNHLDRHGTFDNYRNAKARILAAQSSEDIAVLGWDDPVTWSLRSDCRGQLVGFGWDAPQEDLDGPALPLAVFIRGDQITLRTSSGDVAVMAATDVELRGRHNLLNVLAACAISAAAGFSVQSMRAGILGFRGVPHRLAFVREYRGADWYNDSIATAPERAAAGLRSFDEPVVLLAGGRDKDLTWDVFVDEIILHVKHLVAFGETASMIAQAVRAHQPRGPRSIVECRGLEEAVQIAANLAGPGSVVLLSPGGTSFDEFHDFVERGERFEQWSMALN